MRGVNGNDHTRALASLVFMDGNCICEDQFVDFVEMIGNVHAIKGDFEFLLFVINVTDSSNVPVVNLFVVVVADLHHFIMKMKCPSHSRN